MIRIAIVLAWLFMPCLASAQKTESTTGVPTLLPERILVHTDRDFHLAGQVIWFKVYVTNADTRRPQSVSSTAYAELIGPDGLPALQGKVKITEGVGPGSFLIPASAVSGAYELRVYTSRMKNNPSVFFRKRMTIINTQQVFDTSAFVFVESGGLPKSVVDVPAQKFKSEARFSVQTDKKTYQQRSPVEIAIAPQNDKTGASLSVAVYKLNSITSPDGFHQPLTRDDYAKTADDGAANLPDLNGFVLAARVKDLNGQPASGVPLIASVTGKRTDVKYNESNGQGLAYFDFKDVYGPSHFLLKTAGESKGVQLEFLNSFARPESPRPLQKGFFQKEFLPVVEEMHNNLMVNNTFVVLDDEQVFQKDAGSLSFYGKADVVYRLDDYKRFVTMEEVLREYVREVNVRIRNKNYYLPVFSNQFFALADYVGGNKTMDENPPLILLDGVPISANKLMKYDPLNVEKIEVIADRYMISRNVYDGILSFTTYNGNFEGLELDAEDLIAEEHGWQRVRKFYVPDYRQIEVKAGRVPDFRELLFWEPLAAAEESAPAKISLFTGDIKGEFIVVVKGITPDGRTINESTRFVVE